MTIPVHTGAESATKGTSAIMTDGMTEIIEATVATTATMTEITTAGITTVAMTGATRTDKKHKNNAVIQRCFIINEYALKYIQYHL